MTTSLATRRFTSAKFVGYAQLARPANLVTAAADVTAGYAIAGSPGWEKLALLAGASMLLYAGGVVLNDAFDAPRDRIERPERPIPAGRVTRVGAFVFGAALLGAGILCAGALDSPSLLLAAAIALAALFYDAAAKHHRLLGPLTMATARGLNLLLGVSSAPALLLGAAPLALLPFAHVATLTFLSRGETGGAVPWTIPAAIAVSLILAPLLIVTAPDPYAAAPFAVAYATLLVPSYWTLRRSQCDRAVRHAVRAGVLALIALDAALAAGHAGWGYGLAVLALWPVAVWLARRFSVS